MKIAISATGPSLDSQVDARFGRCACFLIVDPKTGEFEAVENPNIGLGGGAGIQSAQLIAERGVQFVLTGNCGPNAFKVFEAAGIQVVTGVNGPVRQAVEQFNSGAFSSTTGPSVENHFGAQTPSTGPSFPQTVAGMQGGPGGGGRGMGGGGGRGMGGGGGRGMGGGGGRGMGSGRCLRSGTMTQPLPGFSPPGSGVQQMGEHPAADDLKTLKAQAEALEEQLRAIKARIIEADSQ
jgi:predicted Fe-Mo cluster-binding NifX family protein